MKISIRKSKNQDKELTTDQIKFASECVVRYMSGENETYYLYEGYFSGKAIGCDVYRTKTTRSAIVWYI